MVQQIALFKQFSNTPECFLCIQQYEERQELPTYFLLAVVIFLFQGRLYYVRVSAYNMKGWGPPAPSCPPSAAPSSEFWTQKLNLHCTLSCSNSIHPLVAEGGLFLHPSVLSFTLHFTPWKLWPDYGWIHTVHFITSAKIIWRCLKEVQAGPQAAAQQSIWWRYDVILGMFCFTRLCRRQWCADYCQQNNPLCMIYTHTTILTLPLPLSPILHQSHCCCVNMWSLFMVISSKWWGFLCKIPFYHCRSGGCCEGAALDGVWLLFLCNMTFQFVCCTNLGRTLFSPYQPTHTLCCCHPLIGLRIPCIMKWNETKFHFIFFS